ncbi:MAG TPA: TIGR01777 family oxidoreductase, partial [Gaiellaceae bacterium]|nr:TIGR01777 family oxidoreductase [Gaiellaceae bacterium]
GTDAAVNLSGANIGHRWTNARRREIRESRVATTSLLALTLAELEPRPSVFVCAGGVGIYGDRGDEILTEESEPGTGFLASVVNEKEAAAEPAHAAGIRVVNFRQGIVLSAEGGALARMLPFFKLGVGGRVGNGRQWWSWVSLDDVVSAYRFALESELAGPVNVASPNVVRSAQFVKSLGRALHRPTVFPFPAFGVRALWGEMGEAALLDGQRALPAKLLEAGFTFAYADLDAAFEHTLAR